MAITKDKKKQLIKQYVEDLKSSNNTVIVQQKSIPVRAANQLRKDMVGTDGKFNVIRKRLFLRAAKDAGLDDVDLSNLEWSVIALYAKWDEFAPLKVVNKYLKEFKKADKWSEFSFMGWWFGKMRQNADYVNELANIPTKEELISKLLYLFNYPLQSFACVLSEIAKKQEAWSAKPEVKIEAKPEEAKPEAVVLETPVAETPVVEEAKPE
jgi:large subunit ribosomal protein L10